MSDIMRPLPFNKLITRMLTEYRTQGSIFGIRKNKFYTAQGKSSLSMFGEDLSLPIGPAAGPHSQLAQNIVSAYLVGGRFIELKTVQKMDGEELRKCVAKPCINAEDEGYNVEWSTELTVYEAYAEYLKAWFALHVLAQELDLPKGFIFNMSVGYDLEGIQTEKINTYIEDMKDSSKNPMWGSCKDYLHNNTDLFKRIDHEYIDSISPYVSSSITLSTLHGCPPEEIDKIARYLLSEKKLHTYIKCNPTLLGYEDTRRILDEMGYGYMDFDDHHFKNDLQFNDAVDMLKGLMHLSKSLNLAFGVKITNTFPVRISDNKLPGQEMYMSGRALFPLSIGVASKLSQAFEGQLPISYSGGADYFNIAKILETGIRPVTVATTLLKPGGYERMTQIARTAEAALKNLPNDIKVGILSKLSQEVVKDPRHLKSLRPVNSRKTDEKLPLYNCFKAPCKKGGCPIEQQIPEYLDLVSKEDYDAAFALIALDNAAPAITGSICNHHCQNKCTRLDYEAPLFIRNTKKLASEKAQENYTLKIQPSIPKTHKKAAVIGAGPAGIASAYFLRRNGVPVTVFEKREKPFGIVEYVIPEFRIPRTIIERDFRMAEKIGVDFRFKTEENYNLSELKKEYDYIIIATGAWSKGQPPIGEGAENLIDSLSFLEKSKKNTEAFDLGPGKKIAVLGGGNTAADCARAALRIPGVEEVTLVYRRTKAFMPAEPEEIALAEADGVKFIELLSPMSYDGKELVCEEMELGDFEASGRRAVKSTGRKKVLAFDGVISAVGSEVDTSLFSKNGITLNERNRAVLNEHNETNLKDVYLAGDCKAGPSNIVNAIADGKTAALNILNKLGLSCDFARPAAGDGFVTEVSSLYDKKGLLCNPTEDSLDTLRCLRCHQLCEICCDVCPNRANISVHHQILHIDGMCNECGNCGVFCPYSKESGNPYLNKLTLFWTLEDFNASENIGFLKLSDNLYKVRREDGSVIDCGLEGDISKDMKQIMESPLVDLIATQHT